MTADRTLLRVVVAVLAVVLLVPLLMMALMMPMMMAMDGGMMGGASAGMGVSWTMLLAWLVPVAVVGGLGYLLYRVLGRSAEGVTDPALAELRKAYARGDLSDEEFERRRERLEGSPDGERAGR